jgi:hypothetical protein
VENKVKQNIINFEGKELKWDYTIVPCLKCPIYPTRKEWEEEAKIDVRKDKCYTSRCTYNKANAKMVADGIYMMMHYYSCEECDNGEYHPKENGEFCPDCGSDMR